MVFGGSGLIREGLLKCHFVIEEGWSLVGVALSERDYCNATLSLKKGGLDRRVVFGGSGLIRGGLL